MLCIYAMQTDKTTNKQYFEILKKNKNILDYYEKVYAIY